MTVLLMLGMSAATFAGVQPGSTAEKTTEAVVERNRNLNARVCKKVRTTGSHITQRVCLKQKQWDEITDAAQRAARDQSATSATEQSN